MKKKISLKTEKNRKKENLNGRLKKNEISFQKKCIAPSPWKSVNIYNVARILLITLVYRKRVIVRISILMPIIIKRRLVNYLGNKCKLYVNVHLLPEAQGLEVRWVCGGDVPPQ